MALKSSYKVVGMISVKYEVFIKYITKNIIDKNEILKMQKNNI